MSINSTTVRPPKERRTKESRTNDSPSALQEARLGVPWSTVLPLAVVLAFADGFWMVSLRGTVGAIERTEEPFANWLRESTLLLPVFVFAVLGALTLAQRRFGPVLRSPRTVLATALLVVATGTVAGIAEMAASSAYDYRLQSSQLRLMHSLSHTTAGRDQLQQATFALQVHAVGYGSAILLVTNLVLVGWVVAMRGGRLKVSASRQRMARALRQPRSPGQRHSSRADDLRLLLAAGLFGSAAIHAAVVPEHLAGWATLLDPTSAGVFFIVLAAAQLAVAVLLLARPQTNALRAAAVVSIGPLALWLYAQTAGIQFGPGAGLPGQVGLSDWAASALEAGTLVLAVVLLRGTGWLRSRPPASAHVRWLTLVAVIAVTAIGLAGSGLPGLDDFGSGSGLQGAGVNQAGTHQGHPAG